MWLWQATRTFGEYKNIFVWEVDNVISFCETWNYSIFDCASTVIANVHKTPRVVQNQMGMPRN